MARTRGSKNKPKTASSASGPVTTEHNRPPALTDEQRHALVASSVKSYTSLLAVLKTAQADFKNGCKRIKADGVDLEEVKDWIALDTPEGEQRISEGLERTIRIARWRGARLGEQLALFVENEGNAAYMAGKRASLGGAKPVPPNHFDQQEWLRGFNDHQSELLDNFGQATPSQH